MVEVPASFWGGDSNRMQAGHVSDVHGYEVQVYAKGYGFSQPVPSTRVTVIDRNSVYEDPDARQQLPWVAPMLPWERRRHRAARQRVARPRRNT